MASFLHNGPSRPRVCAGTPLRLTPLNQTGPTDRTGEPRRSSAFARARTQTPPAPAAHPRFSCRTTKTPFVLIENGCFKSNRIAHQSKSSAVSFLLRHRTRRWLGGKHEDGECLVPCDRRGGRTSLYRRGLHYIDIRYRSLFNISDIVSFIRHLHLRSVLTNIVLQDRWQVEVINLR